MALSTLVSLRIGSDSMFESHYFRPFLISLCISILMITGMGLSLKGMSGTGAGQEAAEISFDLADAGESEHAEDHPTVTPPPEEAKPPKDAPASVAQKQETKPPVNTVEPQKTIDTEQPASATKREWAVPKAIESEATGGETGVVTHQKQEQQKKLVGNDVSTDPNAEGNGLDNTDKDLSFFADALNLLTPGQRAWLEQSDINPTEYLRQVKEQGQASSVRGEAVVRVNFDASGNVIVGVNTPRIVEDSVPPDVRDEAIRIIKTSGSIVNKRGQVVSLAIPVVLGQ